jgi:hypothetical protein
MVSHAASLRQSLPRRLSMERLDVRNRSEADLVARGALVRSVPKADVALPPPRADISNRQEAKQDRGGPDRRVSGLTTRLMAATG